jgi:hypothetical protein
MAIAHAISTTERLGLILQSITLSQQTGCLSLELVAHEGKEKGEIFFVNGEAVHAEAEGRSGRAAISRMLSWREVRYTFLHDIRALQQQNRQFIRPPIQKPHISAVELQETVETPSVKVPALRRGTAQMPAPSAYGSSCETRPPQEADFSAQVAEKVGGWSVFAIFRARPYATTPNMLRHMERRERIVLLLLNGNRTLRDVSQLVHRSELDVSHVLIRMLKQGYIEFMGG